jgi:type IV secretion system protein VirD4
MIRGIAISLAVIVAGVLLIEHQVVLAVVAMVLLLGLPWCVHWAFWPADRLPRNRVRNLRLRLHLRLHPGRGHATVIELWLKWSRLASYRESKRTRPDLTRRARLLDADAHSTHLGRAQLGRPVRADVQQSGSAIGPPRSFKTAVLSHVAMTAPGALVVTSSKPDLFRYTSGLRAQRGPIWVFNPMGIGGIPSNVRWSPLEGCLVPSVAMRRADAFAGAVSTAGADDSAFWQGKASDGLRGFFSAAALRQADMRQVSVWVGGLDMHEAVEALLGDGREDWAAQLHNDFMGEAEKTASTVRMVMSRALGFLNDPVLAAATLPAPGGQFDVDEFLLSGGTLYMLARANGEDSTLAPLFAALATEIHERALQLASRTKGGRLQPPLQMVLDEVTRIAPVPLPAWLADSGGQGIQVFSGYHGISQLRSRWGEHGAQTVLDCSTVKIVTAGVTDPDMLEHLSKMVGRVSYRRKGQDQSYEFSEIMSESMIRQLPSGFALLIRSNCAPVIVKLARGWRYRPYRKLDRQGLAIAPIVLPTVIAAPEARPTVARLRSVPDAERDTAEVLVPVPAAYPWGGDAA